MNILSVDIGTTSICASSINLEKKTTTHFRDSHKGYLKNNNPNIKEQSNQKILDSLINLINKFDNLNEIDAITLTGQMHGITVWDNQEKTIQDLITWEDQRGKESILFKDINNKLNNKLNPGYGLASLYSLQNNNLKLNNTHRVGTIMDYIAFCFSNEKNYFIDPTNASAFGSFSLKENNWDKSDLSLLNIEQELLPKIKKSGSKVGSINSYFANLTGLKEGLPIYIPIGDNQASLFSAINNEKEDICITLGTGGQISIIENDIKPIALNYKNKLEIRPYFNNQYAYVSSILLGGKSFEWLIKNINNWFIELGSKPIDEDYIFEKLDKLALKANSNLNICPSFNGERYNQNLKGSINNIDYQNFSLTNIYYSLISGTLLNLKNMIPNDLLTTKKNIIGTGSGIKKIQTTQKLIKEIFDKNLITPNNKIGATFGAAKLIS